jgi:uncharacterized membrane protein
MNPQEFQRAKRSTLIGGERDKGPSTTLTVGTIVGTFAGWGLGMYCGIVVLMLVVTTVVVMLVAKKLLSPDRWSLLPSVGLQGGQIIAIFIGMLVTGKYGADVVDIVWCVGALAWLIAKPSRAAVWVLAAYQLFALAGNLYLFLHSPVGSAPFRALIVHMLWRVLSLLAMVVLYRKLGSKPQSGELLSPAE